MKKILSVMLLAILALTLVACGGDKETENSSSDTAAANVSLTDVMAKFNLGEEMITLDQDALRDMYGIESADVKQFAAAINSTGIKCDEVVLIEAVDAEAAARIKTAMDNRYQTKLNETENYLPDEFAIIKTCSVATNGNYVTMIVGANAADLTAIYNENVK